MEKCDRWHAGLAALSIDAADEAAIDREASRIAWRGQTFRALAKWIITHQQSRIGTPTREGKAFAEALAHAKFSEAQAARIKAEGLEYGHDLVEIPESLDACEKCRPFLGRIFSITGKTPGFPKLEE